MGMQYQTFDVYELAYQESHHSRQELECYTVILAYQARNAISLIDSYVLVKLNKVGTRDGKI